MAFKLFTRFHKLSTSSARLTPKAEAQKPTSNAMAQSLHPRLDNDITKGDPNFPGGTLRCHCVSDPVEVTLTSNVQHNHACGCSKCWKPSGALFSIAAVIPRENVNVTANGHKLHIIDPSAVIQRHACRECQVHMYGRIEQDHAFKGLDFVHVELSNQNGWQEVQFASFVSSLIEEGFDPAKMAEVRRRLKDMGLETYDVLPPYLADMIATWVAKKSGRLDIDV